MQTKLIDLCVHIWKKGISKNGADKTFQRLFGHILFFNSGISFITDLMLFL